MQITTYVQYLASITYTFTIFDKYIDPSDYGRTALTSNTVTARQFSNIVLVPQTSIRWRRQIFIKANVDGSSSVERPTGLHSTIICSMFPTTTSPTMLKVLTPLVSSMNLKAVILLAVLNFTASPANTLPINTPSTKNMSSTAFTTLPILSSSSLCPHTSSAPTSTTTSSSTTTKVLVRTSSATGNSNKKIKVTTVDKYASGTLQYFD